MVDGRTVITYMDNVLFNFLFSVFSNTTVLDVLLTRIIISSVFSIYPLIKGLELLPNFPLGHQLPLWVI